MKQNLSKVKKDIIEVGRRAYLRGYVASNDGNFSTRLDAQRVLITPTGISKGFMKPIDLVIIDMIGNVVSGKRKPSSEIYTHLQIYKNRPDVMSICHLHPPYSTAFAITHQKLDQPVLSEVIISLGNIPIVEYSTPGSVELSHALEPLLSNHNVFLLANHGALTLGKNAFDAYFKMEILEHYAHIMYIVKIIGNPVPIEPNQIKRLEDMRK